MLFPDGYIPSHDEQPSCEGMHSGLPALHLPSLQPHTCPQRALSSDRPGAAIFIEHSALTMITAPFQLPHPAYNQPTCPTASAFDLIVTSLD